MVEIRTSAVVANISQRIREARLGWLGHAERKTEGVLKRNGKWKYM